MPDGSRTFDARDPRNPATLAAVYRAHSAYVWRVLRHCGVPDPDLDDAVQETFLVVFRRLPEWQARASLRTWIYAIAVRVASTRRRSDHREAARREAAGEQLHDRAPADPELALCRAEAAALVDRLLDELDAQKRTVFVLAELEGVKVPEISRILGVNPRTVHSRLRLARERFGSALRRERAREEGNVRVARLRPRALLEHAANDRPPVRRRKAAWIALAVRIEQGAVPSLAGWEALTVPASTGAWVVPTVVIGATAVVLAAIATAPRAPTDRAPSTSPTAQRAERPTPPSTTASPARHPIPTAAVLPPPRVAEPVAVPEPSTSAARPASRPASRHAAPPDHPTPPPTAAPDPASTLAAETRRLERARTELAAGDPTAALTELDAYLREFPQGVLLDEARSTRLLALCKAARPDDAAALADRLAPGQPGSRWHQVVAAACR